MKPLRLASAILLCVAASSQAPPGTNTEVPEIGEGIIKSTVTNIVAPTLVTDRTGNIVDGLQPSQFHLFDNKKEQNIQVDVAFEPTRSYWRSRSLPVSMRFCPKSNIWVR